MAHIKRNEKNKISEYIRNDYRAGFDYIDDNEKEVKDYLNKEGDYSWDNIISYDKRRRREYDANGATIINLVEKMWEHFISVNNKSADMDAIEALRQRVKAAIPKD